MSEAPLVATASQTVGPFFHFALTATPHGRLRERLRDRGMPITLRITVRDGDDEPVDDAMIEVAQQGILGRMATDATGACEFETTLPEGGDGQVPHVQIYLFARGLLRHLHTRAYFPGDANLASDAVLELVPEDRRDTLIARREPDRTDRWVFPIRLQGTQETVFFDA